MKTNELLNLLISKSVIGSDNLIAHVKGNSLTVTRAAIAVNPLTCYNVSTGNVMEQFANNVEVKHGDNGFIGGDTLTIEYDCGTKVASSVVECPIRIFRTYNSVLAIPTDSWNEEITQANLDKFKTQEGTAGTYSSTTNTFYAELMLELDLTPLCNQKYGGSNAAIKADLKSIVADVWAMGSGSNGGVLTNGCLMKTWLADSSAWVNVNFASTIYGENNTGAIAKISDSKTTFASDNIITVDNKIYILIHATYPSNGTIASSVSLDYAKITINLNRTVDVVAPKNVYLPKYWAMAGSFSPNYDSSKVSELDRIFALYADANNRITFSRTSANVINFAKTKGGVSAGFNSSAQTFSKNQTYRYIIGQNASGMFMYLFKNNGTVEKLTNTDVNILSGLMQFQPLNYINLEQADMFSDVFGLYDLQALGKSSGFTDAEAEGILRGRVGTKNLFNKSKATNGYSVDPTNGNLIVNASWYASDFIKISPQTTYTKGNASEYFAFYDINKNYISGGSAVATFATPVNAQYVKISVYNTSLNIFQLEQGAIQTTYEPYLENPLALQQKNLFDINAVTLHTNATRSNGVITLNATAAYQNSTLTIPVMPNNKYKITVDTSSTGRISIHEKYNNVILKSNSAVFANVGGEAVITTLSNTNKLFVDMTNTSSGTFIFKINKIELMM